MLRVNVFFVKLVELTRSFRTYLAVFGTSGIWIWVRAVLFRQVYLIHHSVGGGNEAKVWLRSGTTDVDVYKKVFVDKEYEMPFMANPNVILDLGGNIGLASVYYSVRYPEARIISVEPEVLNFELLNRNCSNYPNITPVHGAVWSEDETLILVDPGIGPWGIRVEPTNQNAGEIHIQGFTISTLLDLHFLEKVDILKVDIEGAEKEVFESSQAWIQHVDCIVVELHDRYKPGCSRAFFSAIQGMPHEHWCGENVFVWR